MASVTSAEPLEEVTVKPTPPLSPLALAVRRFRKHKMAMFGLGLLAVLSIFILFGGFFVHGYCAPIDQELRGEAWANCADTSKKLQPPSRENPFGTDVIGRDILARTIYGGQISLMIGISAAFVEVFIGALIGSIAFRVMHDLLASITPQYWTFWIGLFLVVLMLAGRDRLFRPARWFARKP